MQSLKLNILKNRAAVLQTKIIGVSLEKIGTSSCTPSSQCRLEGAALVIGVLQGKHLHGKHFLALCSWWKSHSQSQPTVREAYLMLDATVSLRKRLFGQQELQLQL